MVFFLFVVRGITRFVRSKVFLYFACIICCVDSFKQDKGRNESKLFSYNTSYIIRDEISFSCITLGNKLFQ